MLIFIYNIKCLENYFLVSHELKIWRMNLSVKRHGKPVWFRTDSD